MRRRQFLGLVGGASIAWPLTGHAKKTTLPVVGFLNSASADGYASMAAAFRQGLKETGYVEGNNVAIEYRWADDRYDRLPALASDLVNRRVKVIFANSPSIAAAKAATRTIPIVIMSGDDPVRLGFVASFNRPGGNITGVTILSQELAAKRLDLCASLFRMRRPSLFSSTQILALPDASGPMSKRRRACSGSRLSFCRRTTSPRLIMLSIAWLKPAPTHF
jgi:putative ABC transport system substrate-binding protein